jgi:glycosyltransferase involved in cell wall biosynthesis
MATEAPEGDSTDRIDVAIGSGVPPEAGISVVVMAINGDPRALDAIRSLLAQTVPVEIVVVNTGRGSLRELLRGLDERLVLIESETLRLPGGTRNLGIRFTTKPVVAFLAADCLATPEWAARRIDAHRTGASAVASALLPAGSHGGTVTASSWASYALLHVRRAPEAPPAWAALYGVSYLRTCFDLHGSFPEDLLVGEDSAFNARVASVAAIVWEPSIVTLHRYPEKLAEGVVDSFRRGSNTYRWLSDQRARPLTASIRRALGNWRAAQRLQLLAQGDVRRDVRRAAPLIAFFAACYAAGALWAATKPKD